MADIVIDNQVPVGNAAIEIASHPERMRPIFTITGVLTANTVFAGAVAAQAPGRILVNIYHNANAPGSRQSSEVVANRWERRIVALESIGRKGSGSGGQQYFRFKRLQRQPCGVELAPRCLLIQCREKGQQLLPLVVIHPSQSAVTGLKAFAPRAIRHYNFVPVKQHVQIGDSLQLHRLNAGHAKQMNRAHQYLV